MVSTSFTIGTLVGQVRIELTTNALWARCYLPLSYWPNIVRSSTTWVESPCSEYLRPCSSAVQAPGSPSNFRFASAADDLIILAPRVGVEPTIDGEARTLRCFTVKLPRNWCLKQELNLYQWLRSPQLYPLSYWGIHPPGGRGTTITSFLMQACSTSNVCQKLLKE